MSSHYPGKEIWFLTGSQSLYGEETLGQVAEQSRTIAATLDASPAVPVDIAWKPVLTESAQIRATIQEANSDPRCIGLITWMHTFSPAKMWIAGLNVVDQPILHFHTQANLELPWASIDMDFMNLNQAAHGDREFGYILARLDIPRKIVVGHVEDPRVAAEIGVWTRAAAGRAAVRGSSLVRFGDNMRNVAVTDGDKTEAEIQFGVSVNPLGVADLVQAVDGVDESAVDPVIDEYLDLYDVAPELQPGGSRHESLRYGARQELGLLSILKTLDASAFTTNFEDLAGLQQLPGLAVQRLMAKGYGFGAEGDWKTAILVHAAKVMGQGLAGGASLMEDYTYHLVPGEEKTLGAHMLEICPTLTTSRPSLEIHPLSIGNREDPVRLVFDADEGPAVVVSLTDLRDRFRITANVVDIVPPDAPLPRLPVARAVWTPRPDFMTSAEAWLRAGASHHTAISTAVGLEVFGDFAEMAQTEFLAIDESTTAREFERSVRWNNTYYRLARGL